MRFRKIFEKYGLTFSNIFVIRSCRYRDNRKYNTTKVLFIPYSEASQCDMINWVLAKEIGTYEMYPSTAGLVAIKYNQQTN